MGPLGNLKALLQKNGASITRPRIRVFEILAGSDAPLTTKQIYSRAQDLDKVSVYRTIDLFEKIGITKRVWNGFKSSIELSDEFSPHHHHFTCLVCNKIQSVKSDPLEAIISDMAQNYGFALHQHTMELTGTCKSCIAETGNAAAQRRQP
jgi:Fur family transcriptional regulator, ferric uptake regulator